MHIDGFENRSTESPERLEPGSDHRGAEGPPAEIHARGDGQDGRFLTVLEGDRPKGYLRQDAAGRIIELRVPRDAKADQRVLMLLEKARGDDGPLVAVRNEVNATPSPDYLDLLDLREDASRRCWESTVPPDIARLEVADEPLGSSSPEDPARSSPPTEIDPKEVGLTEQELVRAPGDTERSQGLDQENELEDNGDGSETQEPAELGKDAAEASQLEEAVTEKPHRFESRANTEHPVTGIRYNEQGFPVFASMHDFHLPPDLREAGDDQQMKAATRDLRTTIKETPILRHAFMRDQLDAIEAGKPRIPGFTWHHHQDTLRLQLVDREDHRLTGHVGGRRAGGGKR